jgi:helix-turn-helix protein
VAFKAADNDDPIPALRHPVRRDILRRYHACGCERSAATLASEMGTDLATTSYHVHVLTEGGCLVLSQTIPRRGTHEHLYKSAVEDHSVVKIILNETATTDAETLRRGPATQEAADQ